MSPPITSARAFWARPPGPGVIRPARLRPPGESEILVETLYSAISRGTESLVHQGRVPESQYEAMKAPFQDGAFPGPVKYGYMNVGRVVCGPDALLSRNVFCLFPHQTAYVVPEQAAVTVPEDLPPARAVLAANMETALNAVGDGHTEPCHRVAVIGAGVVGCLTAYLVSRMTGASVELIDIDPDKGAFADALELRFSVAGNAEGQFDRIYHASGSEAGLHAALSLAAFEAEIIELSWFGDNVVGLPLGEHFHSRRLTIRSSQVGHLASAFRNAWTLRDRLAHALGLLADPALDALITGESRFDELPDAMAGLIRRPSGVLCHRIAYAAAVSSPPAERQ